MIYHEIITSVYKLKVIASTCINKAYSYTHTLAVQTVSELKNLRSSMFNDKLHVYHSDCMVMVVHLKTAPPGLTDFCNLNTLCIFVSLHLQEMTPLGVPRELPAHIWCGFNSSRELQPSFWLLHAIYPRIVLASKFVTKFFP